MKKAIFGFGILLGLFCFGFKLKTASASQNSWEKVYNLQASTSFRAAMAVLDDNLYLLAKDPYQADDNKRGRINVFTYDGSGWQVKELPSCWKSGKTDAVEIGNFSDLLETKGKLYFGTYPRTSFASYDGNECKTLFSFNWGGQSTWQTASRGVYFKGKIYFVSNQLAGDKTESSQVRAFDPSAADYPPIQKISDSYQKSDGRDPSQGPLAVFQDRLFFTNGVFKAGGWLGVSYGGGPAKISGSPDINPYAGVASDNRFYFGGWNESTKKSVIFAYDGSSFKELRSMSGNFRPTAMKIFNNQLFVVGTNPSAKPILVFDLDGSGEAVFKEEDGDSKYEATDLEVYKNKIYALVHLKNDPGVGEVWALAGSAVASPTPTSAVASPTPVPEKKGDLNGDGVVNLKDVAIYFLYKNLPLLGKKVAADLNGDGQVNSEDFKILRANF